MRFPFSSPVVDTGIVARDLLLEFVIRKSATLPEPDFWIMDEEWFSAEGSVTAFGQTCSRTTGWTNAFASSESLRPGSSTIFNLWSAPGSVPYLHFVGTSDRDFGGAPILPLRLDPYGAPGCFLYTNPFLVTAGLTDAPAKRKTDGEARVLLHWPLDPVLTGSLFFSQWLMLEPGAHALGVTTSNGVRLLLSSGPAMHGVGVVWNWDVMAPTGAVMTHFSPVVRLVR